MNSFHKSEHKKLMREKLLLLEKRYKEFLDTQALILKYVGKRIIVEKLDSDNKKISVFLKDLQNISAFLQKDDIFTKGNLIWISKNNLSIGALGHIEHNVYPIRQDFIYECRKNANKVTTYRHHSHNSYSSTTYLDTCLNLLAPMNLEVGTLIMHVNIDDLYTYVVSDILNINLEAIILDSDFNQLFGRLKVNQNIINAIKKSKNLNEHLFDWHYDKNQIAHFTKQSNLPFNIILIETPENLKTVKTLLKPLLLIFALLILLFISFKLINNISLIILDNFLARFRKKLFFNKINKPENDFFDNNKKKIIVKVFNEILRVIKKHKSSSKEIKFLKKLLKEKN